MRREWTSIIGGVVVCASVVIAAIGCTGPAQGSLAAESIPTSTPLPAIKGLATLLNPIVPAPVGQRAPTRVKIALEASEVQAKLDDGVEYEFWTYGGTVPGPMLRVRQGDTIELTLANKTTSKASHNIDLHAVTGPGGGAAMTNVKPGETAVFEFKALNPGLYVYHCATGPIPLHISNGMYGLILVEPPGGLPAVDREFYVMEGDLYLSGERGEKGVHGYSLDKLIAEEPDYVVFNGSVGSLSGERSLKAKVGEKVRIFFGAGGPNLTSSFHVIGEIFDRIYPEGASETLTNVQTTLVPAGGATIVDFKLEVPGNYLLVDHSLGRLFKGAVGTLVVEGAAAPEIYKGQTATTAASSSGH